ncbi:MAG: hypothetical protein AAGA33_04740 [Pseudomonadota bacterium]
MISFALAAFVLLVIAAVWLARQQLSFIAFACALMAAVPLLFAADQPGTAFAWIAIAGPIVALGVILDSLRKFT